jgi:hypothetical protein
MSVLDEQPYALGVVYPDRDNPVVPESGATCQEVLDMVGNRYLRCGEPASAVVAWTREIYFMCQHHAWHNVRNRNGRMLAGTCGLAALLPKYSTDDKETM